MRRRPYDLEWIASVELANQLMGHPPLAAAGAMAFLDTVPKTSVGKFDTKIIHQRYADGELEVLSLQPLSTRRS